MSEVKNQINLRSKSLVRLERARKLKSQVWMKSAQVLVSGSSGLGGRSSSPRLPETEVQIRPLLFGVQFGGNPGYLITLSLIDHLPGLRHSKCAGKLFCVKGLGGKD